MRFLTAILILLGVYLVSCTKTPIFPDPGFDATSDVVDTVRRDTIDVYTITMNVNVQNGVKEILVLDGFTYKQVDRVNGYEGQTKFVLSYPIDLKSVTEEDSTFSYIIKVVDNDSRSYNKAFSITVKPFSKPTIRISGADDVLGLVSPLVDLKMFFETGLNTIHGYKVSFNGSVLDQGLLGDSLHEYNYSHVFSLSMVKGQDYLLRVELSDDKGTVGVKEVILKLIDLQRPTKVFVNSVSSGVSKLLYEIDFYYNWSKPDRLDSMTRIIYSTVLINGISTPRVVYYSYHFRYNELNKLSEVTELLLGDVKYDTTNNHWTYAYDNEGRLLEVKSTDDAPKNILVGDWYADGRVKSYAYLPDWPITVDVPYHITNSGEYVTAESFIVSSRRAIATTITPVVIPSYMPEMPPFWPFNTALLEEFQVMFMWKYGYEWIHNYDEAKKDDFQAYFSVVPRYEFGYVTNANGRLDKILRRTVSTNGSRTLSREYLFAY